MNTHAIIPAHDVFRGILRNVFGSILLLFLLPLDADASTPLDCPGVVTVPGGYELTQNATCDRLVWKDDNDKVFNLGGFTFTASVVIVSGSGLTIRDGTLQTNGISWVNAAGKLSKVKVTSAGEPSFFFINAGPDFTVNNCIFQNIPGQALSYYFFSGGTVRHSVFTGNGTAISIQKSSNVVIENNIFLANGTGVQLYNENEIGVNNTTVSHNIFQKNGRGINIRAKYLTQYPYPSLQGTKIIKNQFQRNDSAGIVITVTTDCGDRPNDCPSTYPVLQHTDVRGNHLIFNGFAPPADLSFDDGVTARSFGYDGIIQGPLQALAGVTLSNNRADRNADLGFDVSGVTDGGGNSAKFNGSPAQCDGIACRTVPHRTPKESVDKPAALDQVRHH